MYIDVQVMDVYYMCMKIGEREFSMVYSMYLCGDRNIMSQPGQAQA